jgi:seryl-tRNA synthetase
VCIAASPAALLELALVNFTLSRLVARGFHVMLPPDLVKAHYIAAAGFQPRTAEHTQIYHIRNPHDPPATTTTATNSASASASASAPPPPPPAPAPSTGASALFESERRTELALTGTAEVPIAASFADKVLARDEVPLKVAAFGHCFRTEIGACAVLC